MQSGSQLSPILQAAINEAQAAGSLVVAAAGNDGYERQRFPAAAEGVLSVGALNEALDMASFSSIIGQSPLPLFRSRSDLKPACEDGAGAHGPGKGHYLSDLEH